MPTLDSKRSFVLLPARPRRAGLPASRSDWLRRLAYFWIVWTLLLLVHESGHAFASRRADGAVERVTVGVGPALWRGELEDTELVLRLVPLAGLTKVAHADETTGDPWTTWRRESASLLAGVMATLAVAAFLVAMVAGGERATRRRWKLGRFLIADALVLTAFNLLPVPPLDGGRALVGALAAWRGSPLEADALFWVHLGGFALAILPMTLWTRWTARIDRAALRWGTSLR